MRPLEMTLHGLTLACCAALGAGLWSLSQHEAPAPTPAPSVSESDLQALSREVAGLKREIADLRDRPLPPEAPRPMTAVPPSRQAPESAPAAVVQALQDPKVQERIQAVVDERLDAERKERDQRQEERGREILQERTKAFEEKTGLNDSQKELFDKILAESRGRLDAVRAKVRAKELTRAQAQEDLKAYYAEVDLRVRSVMTADQFKQYQEWSQPFRDMALRGGWGGVGGNDRGRRASRENPVP